MPSCEFQVNVRIAKVTFSGTKLSLEMCAETDARIVYRIDRFVVCKYGRPLDNQPSSPIDVTTDKPVKIVSGFGNTIRIEKAFFIANGHAMAFQNRDEAMILGRGSGVIMDCNATIHAGDPT